jgi:hypothetical protein
VPFDVSITCTPTAVGLRTATLTVTHTAPGTPATYNLTCTGDPPGTPIYDSTPLPNGTIPVGSTAVLTTVTNATALTIRNTGTATLIVSAFNLTGANPTDFTVITSAPFSIIAGGAAVNVSISCTPSALGLRTATLSVTHNASVTPATYTLNCTGVTPSTVVLSPATLPNGAVGVPYNRTITASGGTGGYSFAVTAGTLPPGLNLSAGGILSGTPSTIVGSPFTFTVTATDSSLNTGSRAYTIAITNPTPGYASTPAPGSVIDVGTVQIGTAISTALIITNPGTANTIVNRPGSGLITGPHAADFAITSSLPPFIVPFGGTAQVVVTIRCIPSAAGLRVATLTLNTNAPGFTTVTYTLNCTGSGTAVATATPIGFIGTPTTLVPSATPVLPATGKVTGVKGLALRTGPYLGATLLGKAIPGFPYPILAKSNDEGGGITWYLITVDKVTGWVSGLYLEISGNIDAVPTQGSIFDQIDNAPDVGITARAMSLIDIRRRPSGRAAILTQIPQDATMRILGRTRQNGGDFWVQISYNGVIGWIPAAPIAVNGSTGRVPIR